MAGRLDIKTKTFFQIPPASRDKEIFSEQRVVFMSQGFCLDDVRLITEVYQVTELCYRFFAHIGYSEDMKLAFDFKRKGDALMAQRELSRAWTSTGEFEHKTENGETTND